MSRTTVTSTRTVTTRTGTTETSTNTRTRTTTISPTPTSTGRQIHPNGRRGKCLDVRGGKFSGGTHVQLYNCNGSPAQRWEFNRGDTKIRLSGTNYCLDAGTGPKNFQHATIWPCRNIPAQSWYYTADSRIAVSGKGQCLDLPGGNTSNGNWLQTYKCLGGNLNQVWTD
ncbi:ricin B lectin domain-containing protein [Crassisporium funariophilum]|nr:ricin B lectin domain-containing protein [Crassisporium funariophilum]